MSNGRVIRLAIPATDAVALKGDFNERSPPFGGYEGDMPRHIPRRSPFRVIAPPQLGAETCPSK